MTVGGNRISVSQATMQFEPAGGGTRLVFTEQDAFLDGYDDAGQREAGLRELLESLRSEEHTSELQSLMRNSYAVFCLKKKTTTTTTHLRQYTQLHNTTIHTTTQC